MGVQIALLLARLTMPVLGLPCLYRAVRRWQIRAQFRSEHEEICSCAQGVGKGVLWVRFHCDASHIDQVEINRRGTRRAARFSGQTIEADYGTAHL